MSAGAHGPRAFRLALALPEEDASLKARGPFRRRRSASAQPCFPGATNVATARTSHARISTVPPVGAAMGTGRSSKERERDRAAEEQHAHCHKPPRRERDAGVGKTKAGQDHRRNDARARGTGRTGRPWPKTARRDGRRPLSQPRPARRRARRWRAAAERPRRSAPALGEQLRHGGAQLGDALAGAAGGEHDLGIGRRPTRDARRDAGEALLDLGLLQLVRLGEDDLVGDRGLVERRPAPSASIGLKPWRASISTKTRARLARPRR